MTRKITIKKGLDIKIEGTVKPGTPVQAIIPGDTAIVPDDFPDFTPKVEVAEGVTVAAGEALLHDKHDEAVKLVSPVSGIVKAVVRGDRRKILRIVVTPDGENRCKTHDLAVSDAESIRRTLKESGLWAMMRQRPFDIVPEGDSIPRDIFVTSFDSAPLAPEQPLISADKTERLAKGVAILAKLTEGLVYICRRADSMPDIPGAEMVDVVGPHPSGTVGAQIANIAPVNKGETVWTMDITTLWRIGELFTSGKVPCTATVAVTGSEVTEPHIVETIIGADLKSILSGCIKEDGHHHRIISGNVLTGVQESLDGYLHFPYRQITVIPEGDDVNEFMGWASLSPKKMSQNASFPGKLFGKIFNPDARLLGGKRAFIQSGEYDRYMPMDIMAEYLLKAIIGRDIEQMEKLGIYEVAPEDFALGEYADTSKIEAQKIVREGLDYLRKELE